MLAFVSISSPLASSKAPAIHATTSTTHLESSLQYFIGIQVLRNRSKRQLHINQSGYINSILERFGMDDSKPAPTPIATGTTLHKATDGDALVDLKPYQSLVGSQMYAMLCTRPDIAYAVSQVSQHSSAPTTTHQSTGKRGFRYLNATSTMGITYDGSNGSELEACCDADYAASEGRKIDDGIFVQIGRCSCELDVKA